jgi:hypothetical protein
LKTARLLKLRLASHRLLDTRLQTPEAVVAWMGAVQAQDFNMAKQALGIRLADANNNDAAKIMDDAFNCGSFLRTHVLRPTWHFVSPENIRWMLGLSAGRIKSASKSRDRDLEITEALYTKTNRIITKALEGNKHLTRDDLTKELAKAKINADTARWYHFIMRAELEGLVCSGAVRGKTQTYALLSERAPAACSLPKDESLARLANIYFRSHSPASLRDFAWWSGLSLTEARNGLEAVKSNFIAEIIDEKTYWINPEFSAKSTGFRKKSNDTPTETLVHFLPAFDEYIIAYSDRSAIIPTNYSKAVSSNGIFHPTVVVNGQVVGTWKKPADKTKPIQINLFEQTDNTVKEAVNNAINKMEAHLKTKRGF